MLLFSKRRIIKPRVRILRSIFNEPSLLKFAVLSVVLISVFLFKYWAEDRALGLTNQALEASFSSAAFKQKSDFKKKGLSERSIDVNHASQKELEMLPGIGPKLADAIKEYRRRHGAFHKADDLLRVKGIGAKRLEKIAPYLLFK